MTTSDYIIDSALVLLVILQLKERKLTTRQLVRPLIILAIAVANYLHGGIPTQGNDILLILILCGIGGLIGLASGVTVQMRPRTDGSIWFRSGPASACFWVLGMGSRFAFAYWASHGGVDSIARFSAQHSISGSNVWTVALLGMAVFEVCLRTLTMGLRWKELDVAGVSVAA
jgi:hypothetical protein